MNEESVDKATSFKKARHNSVLSKGLGICTPDLKRELDDALCIRFCLRLLDNALWLCLKIKCLLIQETV